MTQVYKDLNQRSTTQGRSRGTRRPASPKAAAARPGEIDRRLDAELFRALADPTRLKLLACLSKCARPCGVTEVAECCSVDLSVVSRHLAMMAKAGVLESKKDGRTVSYMVRFEALTGALRSLADAIEVCGACAVGCCGGEGTGGKCGKDGCCG